MKIAYNEIQSTAEANIVSMDTAGSQHTAILLAIGNRTETDSNWKCPTMAMLRRTKCPIKYPTPEQNV